MYDLLIFFRERKGENEANVRVCAARILVQPSSGCKAGWLAELGGVGRDENSGRRYPRNSAL